MIDASDLTQRLLDEATDAGAEVTADLQADARELASLVLRKARGEEVDAEIAHERAQLAVRVDELVRRRWDAVLREVGRAIRDAATAVAVGALGL